jgi:hypothetical protein
VDAAAGIPEQQQFELIHAERPSVPMRRHVVGDNRALGLGPLGQNRPDIKAVERQCLPDDAPTAEFDQGL